MLPTGTECVITCTVHICTTGDNTPQEDLRRNPIEDGAISGFSGQKSVPE